MTLPSRWGKQSNHRNIHESCIVLFNSLNRHMLGALRRHADPDTELRPAGAPLRTFDSHYVGSLPCMPARRDMLTGDSPSCIAAGARWSRSTTPSRNCCTRPASTAIWSPTIPLLGGWRRDLSHRYDTTSSYAARRATPGRRWCSRTGSGCARSIMSGSSRPSGANTRAKHHQPRIHQGGKGLPVGAVLCPRL